jgi:hypothetical protein
MHMTLKSFALDLTYNPTFGQLLNVAGVTAGTK